MAKNKSEIHQLLSEPKMFDASIELLNEFEKFQNELFVEFWNKLIKIFKESKLLSEWKIVFAPEIDISYSDINILNKNYKEGVVYYHIYFSPSYFIYGISFDESNNKINIDELYNEAKKFKEYKWRMGNKNSLEMPIYKQIKSIDLKDKKEFKKLLSISIDDTVKDVFNEIMLGFTKDVQNLITHQSKRTKII